MSTTRQPSSSQSSTSSCLLLVMSSVTVALSVAATAVLSSYHHRREIQRLQNDWESRRQEERTGRIRAEVKLRTVLKEQQQQKQQQQLKKQNVSNDDDDNNNNNNNKKEHTMLLSSIGTVTSPFTKRMGTPRQPLLVPASRAFIEFTCPAATLDGIESYSHLWVVFEFHANTNIAAHGASSNSNRHKKTKIRPPRAGGIKVGQLATRSPHRPNCLGLSLVRFDKWDPKTRRLHIQGIDLVHGTPVYDVKPFVPWDAPSAAAADSLIKVPDWVSQPDILSCVDFTNDADAALRLLISQQRLAPLYTNANDGYTAAKATLQQVLAQDPRSSHKGIKSNGRGTTSSSTANNSNNQTVGTPLITPYSLVFCQIQVDFVVDYEDSNVKVVKCAAIEFDKDAYVDGVPLISEQNK